MRRLRDEKALHVPNLAWCKLPQFLHELELGPNDTRVERMGHAVPTTQTREMLPQRIGVAAPHWPRQRGLYAQLLHIVQHAALEPDQHPSSITVRNTSADQLTMRCVQQGDGPIGKECRRQVIAGTLHSVTADAAPAQFTHQAAQRGSG